jgi:hypothetical protein
MWSTFDDGDHMIDLSLMNLCRDLMDANTLNEGKCALGAILGFILRPPPPDPSCGTFFQIMCSQGHLG